MLHIPYGRGFLDVYKRQVCDIEAGNYVHTHNLSDPISNWKKNYLYEFDPEHLVELDDSLKLSNTPKLYGYRRKNGLVGFRNYVAVLSTCLLYTSRCV